MLVAGITTFEWKSYGDNIVQNYPFNIDYDGKSMVMTTFDANWQDGKRGDSTEQVWERKVDIQEWITLIVAIKLSRDPAKGYIELYCNGKKQTFSNGAKATALDQGWSETVCVVTHAHSHCCVWIMSPVD